MKFHRKPSWISSDSFILPIFGEEFNSSWM
jgi:hypothetical protein